MKRFRLMVPAAAYCTGAAAHPGQQQQQQQQQQQGEEEVSEQAPHEGVQGSAYIQVGG
jgi:hypothetical protein